MIRQYALVFVLAVLCIGMIDCGGGGGKSSGGAPGVSSSTSTIVGSAVKGPIEGAEVHLYYFDEEGNAVEIPSVDGPVYTDATGEFSFSVDGTDLMGITSPLVVRTEGGSMYGSTAPSLAAVIVDPQPLTFARVTVSCYLSAASSVAAALLDRLAQSMGSAPLLEDAQRIIAQVEDQLRLDLSEDPADVRTRTGMLNECIDQNLGLQNTLGYNDAVEEFIDYLTANLSSSSGMLDDLMDDPYSPGTDTPASFDPFGTGLLSSIVGSDPAGFILMSLTSDVTYLENDWTDTAEITVTVRDAAGRPCQDLDAVQLGLLSGPGILWSAGMSYSRGEVLGELTSDTTGDTGDIVILAICPLSNGNEISQDILIQALDFYVDKDSDGLSDGDEELERTIYVDVAGFGLTAFSDKLVKYEDVTSDPRLLDTDGDGLDDYTEFILKTHPRMVDTDGDGLTDEEEINRWHTNPLTVDTDFDAGGLDSRSPNPELFDGNELAIYRTSPSLQDTDGDGRTDFEEVFLLNRNPLISDLPKLEMEIVDAVDVRLDVTYAEEVGETYQYGSEMMKSTTRSQSNYEENSIEVGVEVKHSFGVISSGTEASLKFGYGHKWSTTTEHSQTTQESHSKYITDSRTRTETAASGSMTAGIRLRNTGNIAYTLSKMGIAVRHREQTWDENQGQLVKSFKTVATLVPSLGGGISLAPGEATPVLQVEATGLNTDRVKELLKRPDSLYLEDEYFELENAEGLNYAFLKEVNLARTASIVIDPGQNNAEEYRVATNVQRGEGRTYPGVTLGETLSDILNVDFATIGRKQIEPDSPTNERLLFRVRDLETNLADPDLGYWAVVLLSENPPSGLYDFDKIPVKAGDRVLLVYVRDTDGDGTNDLLEQNYGTHDAENLDYDGDGLSDYEEVFVGWQVSWTDSAGEQRTYDVVSDPANPDQDADGLSDGQEKEVGTDPSNPDTDRDGIKDVEDLFPLTQAKVLYVDKNAPGGAECSDACSIEGECWECAYTDLQDALTAARTGYGTQADGTDDVAEIWVADGVYKPGLCDGQANPVYCSFKLVNTVGVYGGFRGIEEDHPGETKRSQRDRDPRTNATLLSGDLNDNDHVWPDDYTDNTCHIVQADGSITGRTAIDGFTIMGGNAPATQPFGGGMWIGGPGVVLKNIFFTDNHSSSGGGALRVSTRGATIRNCIFTENHAHPDDDGQGGAIYVDHYKDVSIEDCFFRGNTAGYRGGGIHTGWHTRVIINNSDFVENISGPATARWTQGGGAWIGDTSKVIIKNSRFIGNETRERGGGVYVDQQSDVQVIQSLFRENKTVMNDSSAYESGGGMCVATLSRTAIVNSTFIENETNANGAGAGRPGQGGGVFVGTPKSFRVDNSIFWGNDSKYAPDDTISNQMYSSDGDFSKWLINTSCIQSYGSYSYWLKISGYGNIWKDPSLSANGTPTSGSPVIDAGNTYVDVEPLNAGYQSLPEVDLAGKPRLVDGDTNGFADVDMGAYEHQP